MGQEASSSVSSEELRNQPGLHTGVLDQKGGTCYAAGVAKAMRDAAGQTNEWMLERYVELVAEHGANGGNQGVALQSICNKYDLHFKRRGLAEMRDFVSGNGTGAVIGFVATEGTFNNLWAKKSGLGSDVVSGIPSGGGHVMAVVRADSNGIVAQNSAGPEWHGTSMAPGCCRLDNGWLSGTWSEFYTIHRNGSRGASGSAYASDGHVGASFDLMTNRSSVLQQTLAKASVEAQFNGDGIGAMGNATVFETSVHSRYAGARVGVCADTGVHLHPSRVELCVLGFGFKVQTGGLQLSTPFVGVTLGDDSRFGK